MILERELKELEEKISEYPARTRIKLRNLINKLKVYPFISEMSIEWNIKYGVILKAFIKCDSTLPKEFLRSVVKNKHFCGLTIEYVHKDFRHYYYLTFMVPYSF
jgi:hypothetical protein